ncbi:hypothetical protein QIY50_24710 [Pseudomonas putida]|nr:hypothetical protein QIY50_24710 [Pseudomonas putida]
MTVQESPEIDDVVAEILEAYGHIGRSRQYVGMFGAPAPIAPSAIVEYLDRYPSVICREEFDAAVFALDEEFRKRWSEEQEKQSEKRGEKGSRR